MEDTTEDFKKLHDEVLLENAQLKAKLQALEEFVKSAVFLLYDTTDYRQLEKKYIVSQSDAFDELIRDRQFYDARAASEKVRDYFLTLNQQMDKLK